MKEKKRLGELLIEAEVIAEEEIDLALELQRGSDLKLGEILIQNNFIEEDALLNTIARQLNIERYGPDEHPIDSSVAELLPVTLAQKQKLCPLKKQGKLILVAMIDPLDIDAIDQVEAATHCEVEPIICAEHELVTLTSNLYGQYVDLDGIMDSVADTEIEVTTGSETSVEEVPSDDLQDLAEEAPVIRLVNSILVQAIKEGASDVHILPEKESVAIQFRVDGKLQDVPSPPKSMFMPMIYRLKIMGQMDITSSLIPLDGRFSIKIDEKEINVRVSTMPTVYGENVVMRLLDTSTDIYTLEMLGMSVLDVEKIRAMISKPYGMILSTGPTGSGKSTSLYSILKEIYKPELNVITLEDPVEYRLDKIRQAQLNRKAGMTFASGLRAILRQDPDVIMVGEIRDAETAGVAVQAAMTGHLVLSTVHTNNAAGAITRLINMDLEPFLISSVMLAAFAQRLIRKICPHCAEPFKPHDDVMKYWGLDKVSDLNLQKGKGCVQCRGSGYKGRVGVFETLVVDETVQEMILQNKSSHEIAAVAEEKGDLHTLKSDAIEKVSRGITTLEEAARAVMG